MRAAQQYKARRRESFEEQKAMEHRYHLAEPERHSSHVAMTIAVVLCILAALVILASPEFGRKHATILALSFGVGALVSARVGRS